MLPLVIITTKLLALYTQIIVTYVLKKIPLPSSAISLIQSNISFKGNSYTLFYNNTARTGEAIYNRHGEIFFEEKSTTQFCYNTAKFFSEKSFLYINQIAYNDGGAIYSVGISHITFRGNSSTLFHNNVADHHGEQYLLKLLVSSDFATILQ